MHIAHWPRFLVAASVLLASCSRPEMGTDAGAGGGAGVGGSAGAGGGAGTVGSDASAGGGAAGARGGVVGPGEQIVFRDAGSGAGGVGGGVGPVAVSCADSPYSDAWTARYAPDANLKSKVSSLVGGLTTAQRANQMRGTDSSGGQNYSDIFRTLNDSGIRGFKFRDGPRGVNLAAELPVGKQGYSTAFPAPILRGAAFDMDLERRIGAACGDETLATGNTMLLAPTVNVLRHPAWGRAQETYGEDPFLLGRLGRAFVVGVQEYVPACVKHYAANNIENGRTSINASMDEQTLREVYAWHYEEIVVDGGVSCVMAAYNLVNGKKCTQNKHLLTDLLRGDWKFQGFVMSDWWAMPKPNTSADAQQYATESIGAGLDMELPWNQNFAQIDAVVGSGALQAPAIAAAATRIVEQKMRFNVADPNASTSTIGLKRPTTTFNSGTWSIDGNSAHVALAHEAARKGITLLKNDKGTLPIKRASVKTVAVVGASVAYAVKDTNDQNGGTVDFATGVRLGDLGSARVFADPAKSVGPAAGIAAAAGSGIKVVTATSVTAEVSAADFVVVVAGLTPEDEGEEYTGAGDRRNFGLDGKKGGSGQNNLIAQVAGLRKPMAVVLEAGSVVDMPWLEQVPAVVMAWYPGMVGGKALGELLFGDANFSGKLPITWPKAWADEPPFPATTMEYELGYRWFDAKGTVPLYFFGHGLSYTTFAYENLVLGCGDVTKNGVVNVSVDVTNTGSVKGDEVVMLFVLHPESKARRPVKALKGFYRVSLDPGATKRVTMALRLWDLRTWNVASAKWEVESGPVQVMVGPDAGSLPLRGIFSVK